MQQEKRKKEKEEGDGSEMCAFVLHKRTPKYLKRRFGVSLHC